MATLLPSSKRPVHSFVEWVDYVRHRLAQATKLDPWRGMPKLGLALPTRRDALLFRLAVACAATAVVAAFLLPWPFAVSLLTAAAGLGAWVVHAAKEFVRETKRWNDEAEVVVGALIMANEGLYDSNDEQDLPGVLVVTRDPQLMVDPVALKALSWRLGALKNKELALVPEELRAISASLTAELGWFPPLPVPRSWAGNDVTVVATSFFFRDWLPRRVIDRRVFPLLAPPRLVGGNVKTLPLEMWWRDDFDRELDKDFCDEVGASNERGEQRESRGEGSP